MKKLYPIYVGGEWERNAGEKEIIRLIENWGDYNTKERNTILRIIRMGKRVRIDALITVNK